MPRVSYIPQDRCDEDDFVQDVIDGIALLHLGKDIFVLLRNIEHLPTALSPLRLATPLPGVSFEYVTLIRDYILTTIVTVVEVILLVAAIPAITLLYGWMFLVYCCLGATLIASISSIMWGSPVVYSQAKVETGLYPDEKWIFINGIGTSHCMLQTTCDMLHATFRRPITGIHNKSYGIVADVFECLLMRSFGYKTKVTHTLFDRLKIDLVDDDVKKLVLIAHSQGGMITSLALDHLYMHVPAEVFAKLEIYTFGSAATHFHNPLLPLVADVMPASTTPSTSNSPPRRYIPTIEHYVNSADVVPRWGVLYHVRRKPESSYSGHVFVHENATGHLFDQHYLEIMFPLLGLREVRKYGEGADVMGGGGRGQKRLFVDHFVVVDEIVGVERARTWMAGDVQGCKQGEGGGMTKSGGIGLKVRGVTVRDLSRFWRYVDGGRS